LLLFFLAAGLVAAASPPAVWAAPGTRGGASIHYDFSSDEQTLGGRLGASWKLN
jgi:hypothetical protein